MGARSFSRAPGDLPQGGQMVTEAGSGERGRVGKAWLVMYGRDEGGVCWRMWTFSRREAP